MYMDNRGELGKRLTRQQYESTRLISVLLSLFSPIHTIYFMTIQEFVSNNVLYNQTHLIEESFKKEIFEYDEIENLYPKMSDEWLGERMSELMEIDEKTGERTNATQDDYREWATEEWEENNGQEAQEVFSWYLISDFLAEELKKHNEPILSNEYGTWWGRTTFGQSIEMDSVIEDIYNNLTK